jgi:hypothetical protein
VAGWHDTRTFFAAEVPIVAPVDTHGVSFEGASSLPVQRNNEATREDDRFSITPTHFYKAN